jgi:hypothetical protein
MYLNPAEGAIASYSADANTEQFTQSYAAN